MTEVWPSLGPSFADYGSDWDTYCSACYDEYKRDFIETSPVWPVAGKRFSIKRQPLVDGRCHTFWHIISEGDDESSRTRDLDRCARITWPRVVLDEFAMTYPAPSSDRIAWWVEQRGGEKRIHIATEGFSYLVVVADRGNYVLLWTAFPIDRDHQRRRRKKAFDSYWAEKAKAAPSGTAS